MPACKNVDCAAPAGDWVCSGLHTRLGLSLAHLTYVLRIEILCVSPQWGHFTLSVFLPQLAETVAEVVAAAAVLDAASGSRSPGAWSPLR